MADFDDVFNKVKNEFSSLIIGIAKGQAEEALTAGKEYLELLKDDLKVWSEKVVLGELSLEDVEWLVNSKKELFEMILLKQKGLSLVSVGHLKNTLSQMLIGVVTKNLGI